MLSSLVIKYSIVVFITQVIFLWSRTWNVQSVARGDVKGALLSGTVVHITWLLSLSLGVTSMNEVISNFDISFVPVVVCSLFGGLLGTYWSMKNN